MDVVHLHSALAPAVTMVRAGLLLATARLRGARVLVHAHGGLLNDWARPGVRMWLLRACLAPAHAVLAVSRDGYDLISGVRGTDTTHHVPNGVDVEAYGPPQDPHSPPRILYLGLLTPRKGVVDLIHASNLLRTSGIEHELWIAGGTPDEGPEAEEAVRRAADRSAVQLLGPQEPRDVPRLYRQADVFCLPSWWEAMPLTVLEAMASGLPVVATAVGEIPNMVEHEVSGLIVPPKQPELLAAALGHLLTDVGARQAMGHAGRQRCRDRYGLDHVVGTLARHYDLRNSHP